ncbi:hypothetical protein [Bacillus atrophaeus]|uniref:hypothetical protein n=1 Tax=Bacillus atrophaeus TaxID=1452 RepID=UPI0022825FD3|nr:hypothetical protein [Bacillus atrophaeus]MCY8922080.1 hypothetical protein [Bacillus atrophaeus]
MEDKRDDHWGTLNKKQQLIVTDVMKKRPYTSKGNRSYTGYTILMEITTPPSLGYGGLRIFLKRFSNH